MRLRVEVAELQQRMLTLEQNAERERQQNEQLQKVVQQLQSLRDEQQSAADARLQSERAAAERAAAVRAAVGGLMSAVQQLTTGDTNIGWALDNAQNAPIGPSAQKNLQMARSALYNEDLSVAGSYLVQAISDAQAYGAR
jgi:phage I-like protein